MPQIQVRRGTTAQWTAANPILAAGEPGYDIDLEVFKIGNGTDHWLTLPAGEGMSEADADARYAPVLTPLREHMLKRLPLHEVSAEFTQCTVSSTVPTFTSVSYAASGADLPKHVSMLGGAWSFDFSSYWRNTGLTDSDSPTGALSFMTNANHFCVQSSSFGAGDVKVYADGKPFNFLATASPTASRSTST